MDGPGFHCFQWSVIFQWGHFLTSKHSSELPQSALVVLTWCFLQDTLISTYSTFQLLKPAMKKSPGLFDYLWAWTLLLSTLTGRRWGHFIFNLHGNFCNFSFIPSGGRKLSTDEFMTKGIKNNTLAAIKFQLRIKNRMKKKYSSHQNVIHLKHY